MHRPIHPWQTRDRSKNLEAISRRRKSVAHAAMQLRHETETHAMIRAVGPPASEARPAQGNPLVLSPRNVGRTARCEEKYAVDLLLRLLCADRADNGLLMPQCSPVF